MLNEQGEDYLATLLGVRLIINNFCCNSSMQYIHNKDWLKDDSDFFIWKA